MILELARRRPLDRPMAGVVHARRHLVGEQPPPVAFTWEGWEQHDGLWFPTAHRRDSTNVFTNKVETVHAFAPGEFEKP